MMKAAADGLPELGDTFARLGVRPSSLGRRGDVRAVNPGDLVQPRDGGMSVAADSPDHLPVHMQPANARFPIWEIDAAELGEGLIAYSGWSTALPSLHRIEK